MSHMKALFISFGVLVVALPISAQNATNVKESLRFSCNNRPFLSISVSTMNRDSFPEVELKLKDPNGKAVGAGGAGKAVPNSQYGRVVEIPKIPRTKAIAIEICDSIQGDYEVTLRELDSGSQYRLSVRADDGRNTNTGNISRTSYYESKGRLCRFGMRVRFEKDDALIYWLNDSGDTTPQPSCLSGRIAQEQ